jgi:putative tryptophan/tyrosine transport system substrate-binding protein
MVRPISFAVLRFTTKSNFAGCSSFMSCGVPPLEPPFFEAEYRRVLLSMTQQGVETLIVADLQDNLSSRRLIVKLAEERRLPTIYPYRECVDVGGLMSYSVDLVDMTRHAVHQIDSILKGAPPGEIPFYWPKKITLTINVKTAKTLGIEIPSSLFASADEVIE